MSHFLYVHSDLTGVKDVWKVGVAITPYSAVRARQKFCWKQFGLDYLWFGYPTHIAFLEERIKYDLWHYSGNALKKIGTQTEIFQIDIAVLKEKIATTIEKNELCVEEIKLESPYVASSSGQCPYGVPSEKDAHAWLQDISKKKWPNHVHLLYKPVQVVDPQFDRLFESC